VLSSLHDLILCPVQCNVQLVNPNCEMSMLVRASVGEAIVIDKISYAYGMIVCGVWCMQIHPPFLSQHWHRTKV